MALKWAQGNLRRPRNDWLDRFRFRTKRPTPWPGLWKAARNNRKAASWSSGAGRSGKIIERIGTRKICLLHNSCAGNTRKRPLCAMLGRSRCHQSRRRRSHSCHHRSRRCSSGRRRRRHVRHPRNCRPHVCAACAADRARFALPPLRTIAAF